MKRITNGAVRIRNWALNAMWRRWECGTSVDARTIDGCSSWELGHEMYICKNHHYMRFLSYILLGGIALSSCNSEDPEPPSTPAPSSSAALAFSNITFTSTNAYFSTTNGMTQPVTAAEAQPMAADIDITFIYTGDYSAVGFLAPLTRSQVWYWNQYNQPWLSVADSTELFATTLTASQFTDAKSNAALIGTYFSNTASVYPAPHSIFPTGTCVGGRQSYNPASFDLNEGTVVGFMNHVTGKRGLIKIAENQEQLWEILTSLTKVDIIREP